MNHEVLAEIVDITRHYGNDDRLHWNVYKLPHHCSYTAIGPDKGGDKTAPTDQVEWLCETQGERLGYVVATSTPIPSRGRRRTMTCSRRIARRRSIIGRTSWP